MFRKRTPKYFPPGTFIATPARVVAILQLCVAFSIFLWIGSKPFMQDHFRIKSKMLIFQDVLGVAKEKNKDFFDQLPPEKKGQILKGYALLTDALSAPFVVKFQKAIYEIVFGIPFLKLMWLLGSIILSILLLLRVEGAVEALWLLPLLAAAYAVENRIAGVPSQSTVEERLFPSEEFLINNYLSHPLSKDIFEQQRELQYSWERYLIENWTNQTSSNLGLGLFNFNVARLESMDQDGLLKEKRGNQQESIPMLFLYIFWNLSYVLIAREALSTQQKLHSIK